MRIIILNCYSRNSLAVINSLDPSYELIGGAAKKNLFFSPDKFFKSPRLSSIFRYTNPKKNAERFKEDIIKACNLYKADALIPTGTTTTNFISYFKKEISNATETKILVEDFSSLSKLTDKWSTYNLCIELEIPVPKTILLKSENDIEYVLDTFSFPVLIKPRISYASKGVKFFDTPKALVEYMNENGKLDSSNILQEVIKGELHDVTLCARKGEILSMLTQQRLLSFYDFGGGGIINKTTYEPQLMEYGEKICKHLKWDGVLEMDFIKHGEDYYLLECNPKIWGTTHLTVKAGLNVVQQLIDTFVLNKPVDNVRNNYKVGLVYKWIFPECVSSWFHKPITLKDVYRRLYRTFRKYDSSETITNLKIKDLPHLIGILLNHIESKWN